MARMGRVTVKRWEQERPEGTLSHGGLMAHHGSWRAAVEYAIGETTNPTRGPQVVPRELVLERIQAEAERRGVGLWTLAHHLHPGDPKGAESTFSRWSAWRRGVYLPSLRRARADLEALGIAQRKEAA